MKIIRDALMLRFPDRSEFKGKFGTASAQVGVTMRILRRATTGSELTTWAGGRKAPLISPSQRISRVSL